MPFMTFSIPNYRVTFVCTCGHMKRDHWCTKGKPQGPCWFCDCSTYTPEPFCECGHGRKAHFSTGTCRYRTRKCGCSGFKEAA
jgi:hypothetical protein